MTTIDFKEMSRNTDAGAKSFYKMASVLDCFSRARPQLSITDMVELTGLPRTTIHRIVASLREIGMIDQDQRRGDYRLGLRMFYYGSSVIAHLDLNRRARPYVTELHQITGEIVHLHIFDGSQMACIERQEMGENRLTTLTTIEAAPIHCTGVGKAFLAFQDETLVARLIAEEGLERRTGNTLDNTDALARALEEIRDRGYARDDEENEIGVRCIGAPIRDGRGRVFASISVSGPAERLPLSRQNALAPTVIEAANNISSEFGWYPKKD